MARLAAPFIGPTIQGLLGQTRSNTTSSHREALVKALVDIKAARIAAEPPGEMIHCRSVSCCRKPR